MNIMQCPECGGKGRVTSTFDHGTILQRYRRCGICGHKWRSWEESDGHKVKEYKPRKKSDTHDLFNKKEAS